MAETQTYTFSSKPQAVQANRKAKGCYREDQEDAEAANIMFDRRVFRGSTYSKHTRTKQLRAQQQKESKRRKNKNMRRDVSLEEDSVQPHEEDPPPAPGHKHMDVQTDTYLEELTDKVPETDMETQTDPFMDRPSLPLYMPAKTGVDTSTQVDVDELFDFDAEVEPILEVLVGKTLEHAMMEVLEEEELAAIRSHQEYFEQERNVERAQVQRLEAEAIRRNEERNRRKAQEQERLQKEAEVMDKVAARAFASDYLADLHSNVFDKLMETGQLYDPLIKEVEDAFLPWLINSVQQGADNKQVSRQVADYLIQYTLEKAKKKFQQHQQDLEDKKKRLEEERRLEEEQEQLRLQQEAEQKEAGEEGADDEQQKDEE